MSGIVISKDAVYPAAALVSTFWLTLFQTINVGRSRKRANIPYPQLYAEKAEAAESKEAAKFNCAQRAHQNTLEYLPTIITGTLITSLKHPTLAAAACGAWVASRFIYTIGYSSGDPAKRNRLGAGQIGALSWFTLIGASTWTVVQLIRAL